MANQVEKDPGRSSRDRTKPSKMSNLEDGKMEIDVVSLHIRGYGRNLGCSARDYRDTDTFSLLIRD